MFYFRKYRVIYGLLLICLGILNFVVLTYIPSWAVCSYLLSLIAILVTAIYIRKGINREFQKAFYKFSSTLDYNSHLK